MRAISDLRAVSRLALILVFLIAMVLGALMSYMFVMGYYVSIGFQIPTKTSVTIVNAAFSPQNARLFNVSLLNPSYSPSNATINQIAVVTGDNAFHEVSNVDPPLPHEIKPSESRNFTCFWDWSNYTGEDVSVIILIDEKEGSGATFKATIPFVGLMISEVQFNATISTLQFNVTVQNSERSVTYVNVTKISVATEIGQEESVEDMTPELPYALNTNASETFICAWNWTDYRSKGVTVSVYTLQGYRAHYTQVTPPRVILNILEAPFDPADTTYFNVTVRNSELSSISVNVTEINVALENGTVIEITQLTPPLPHTLDPGVSSIFTCLWDWTNYRNRNITIGVYTLQGYEARYDRVTPALVILNITEALFNLTDTTCFNVTVQNSALSSIQVDIVGINVILENGTIVEIAQVAPSLPYVLQPNRSVTFLCSWNWTTYQGQNVTITVYTQQGPGVTRNQTIPSPEEAVASSKISSLRNRNYINLAWLLSLSTSPPILRRHLRIRLFRSCERRIWELTIVRCYVGSMSQPMKNNEGLGFHTY